MKKKIEKKGTSAQEINRMATTSTRNVGSSSKSKKSQAENDEKIRRAQELAKNAKPGSLTDKANLVARYNNGQKSEQSSSESEKVSEKKGKK